MGMDRQRPPGAVEVGDVSVRQGVFDVVGWLERAEAKPGSSVRYALRVRLDPGWHVNGPEAPAGRVASALAAAPKSPVSLGPPGWPGPKPVADGAPAGYAGTFWVRGEVHVPPAAPPGPRRVSLLLTLQPCDAASCRAPEEVRLDFALRFADADGPARHAAVFAK
jgi:hypothetical protein